MWVPSNDARVGFFFLVRQEGGSPKNKLHDNTNIRCSLFTWASPSLCHFTRIFTLDDPNPSYGMFSLACILVKLHWCYCVHFVTSLSPMSKFMCCARKLYHQSLLHYTVLISICFQGNMISTPAIKGTILPGITRKSIIDVARSQGFQVLDFLVYEMIDGYYLCHI